MNRIPASQAEQMQRQFREAGALVAGDAFALDLIEVLSAEHPMLRQFARNLRRLQGAATAMQMVTPQPALIAPDPGRQMYVRLGH